MATAQQTIVVPDDVDPVAVYGVADESLRAIEDHLSGVEVWARDQMIGVSGDPAEVSVAVDLLHEMITEARSGSPLSAQAVARAVSLLTPRADESATEGLAQWEVLRAKGRVIRAQTPGQKAYVDAIDNNSIIFGIGPAGTGKTYLAMAKAVGALLSGKVDRIILTRPAVEAGESLGFLPGSLTQKIDPYLRPLYDALRDMMEPDDLSQVLESGTIEVAPLAYMRGRTLSDAFIVLDEAQNTTPPQMKMFLTRLGFRSTMVVTGDISQVDLPGGSASGLRQVRGILDGVDGVAFSYLTSADVVRNALVGRIIDAYERWDARNMRNERRTHARYSHKRREERRGY